MNKPIITESQSGWHIYPPHESKPIGPFPTYADAERACDRNAWDVREVPPLGYPWCWVLLACMIISGAFAALCVGLLWRFLA